MGKVTNPPIPLNEEVSLEGFQCGNVLIDGWLKKRALKNEKSRASRTFVLCEANKVIGYYALAAGSIFSTGAAGRISRNMPDPIPVMVLGRLGVDIKFQHQGIGHALLRDAILRTLEASKIAGIRALLVHALDKRAASFYKKAGFIPSPIDKMTLMITLDDALIQLKKGFP